MTQPEWLVCVHEAGHILGAYVRGGTIKSVSVDPSGEILGSVYAEFDNQDWRSLCIFLMAGFWAQHHIYGSRYPWGYARRDRQIWEQTLRRFRARKGIEEHCFQIAQEIVLDHEELIVAVAKALQQGQDKDQICNFLSQVYPKGSHGQYKTGARRRN